MGVVVRVVFLCVVSSGLFLEAQILQPIVPLPLAAPQRTQLPSSAVFGSPQCDSSGNIYLRYATPSHGSYSSSIARIEGDGSMQTVSLSPLPDAADHGHTLIFAADRSGSLHEIVRAADDSDRQDAGTHVEYLRYDSDGDLRSNVIFSGEFIPSSFLPLPNGDFFASGVDLQPTDDGVSENVVSGVFGPDARLRERLRPLSAAKTTGPASGNAASDGDDFPGAQTVRLGDDGNIYMLLASDHATVNVVSQSGTILRQLKLQEPFETDVASDMWVSGNRLLVVYEGEADDPKDSYVYMLYDTQSGDLIRAYKPQFLGTVACFQDGQTLSVLVHDSATGETGIGTAELQ